MNDTLLTTSQVAERCGVSRRTVTRWIDAGALAGIFTTGGHRRVPESELDAFLESRKSLRAVEQAPRGRRETLGLWLLVLGRNPETSALLRDAAARLGLGGAQVSAVDSPLRAGLLIGRRAPAGLIVEAFDAGAELPRLCADLRSDPSSLDCWLAVVGVPPGAAGSLAGLAHAVVPGRLSSEGAEAIWRSVQRHGRG